MKITMNSLWFILRHLLFWLAVWVILVLVFSTDTWHIGSIDLWYAAFFLPGLMLTVYLTRFLVVPLLKRRSKPIAFFIIALGLASGTGRLLHEGTMWLGDKTLDQFYFGEYDLISSIIVNTIVQFLALGLHFSLAWFRQQTKMRDVQHARLQSEIRLLRSQLEPHFLFNSLNSLYALSLRQDPHTPQAILELAELLRYVQLSSTRKEVYLQEEWDFLLKYKNIQALRLDKKVELSFESAGRLEGRKIVPLLLINPVENAFKHFQAPIDGKGSIRVFLQLMEDQLYMTIQNSFRPDEEKKQPGTGLAHLKKQLQIHYPEKHELSFETSSMLFVCEMKIDLS
jgi:two-component system LytT family sensor kinase